MREGLKPWKEARRSQTMALGGHVIVEPGDATRYDVTVFAAGGKWFLAVLSPDRRVMQLAKPPSEHSEEADSIYLQEKLDVNVHTAEVIIWILQNVELA